MSRFVCERCGRIIENNRLEDHEDDCALGLRAEVARLTAELQRAIDIYKDPAVTHANILNGRIVLPNFYVNITDDFGPVADLRAALDAANEAAEARAEKAEATLNAPALASVLEERIRQEEKWGEQNHNPYVYLSILMEEVGEMAQAALQTQYGGKHGGLDHLREEAVQTAAVALAIVECLDRGLWCW